MIRARVLLLTLVPALAPVSLAATETACPEGAGTPCFFEAATPLLDAGRSREAIDLLKLGTRRHPDDEALALLLARAYLAEGNDLWALRTLAGHAGRRPGACEVRSWLAWMRLRRADLAGTRRVLESGACPAPGPSEVRWALMSALMARYDEAPERAREALLTARDAAEAWPEDAALVRRLSGELLPGWSPPVRARVDLQAGGTSNALAETQTSARTAEALPSGWSRLDAWAEAVWPGGKVRPALTLDLRTKGFGAEAARSLSFVDLGLRPGLVVGTDSRLLVAYRFDVLGLAGDDPFGGSSDPYLLFEAHRAELELDHGDLHAFAGGGVRRFREAARSRLELDLGLGGRVGAGRRFLGIWAVSGRRHLALAVDPRWDLWGATAVAAVQTALPWASAGRLGLAASWDRYPGWEATPRSDYLLKASLGVSRPISAGLRGGVTGELAGRASTADGYDYIEARILCTLSWSVDLDPTAPRTVATPGHVPLEWEPGDGGALDQERIQDLLRQDESVRRGSSCVN